MYVYKEFICKNRNSFYLFFRIFFINCQLKQQNTINMIEIKKHDFWMFYQINPKYVFIMYMFVYYNT